jgi:hypothetical protein
MTDREHIAALLAACLALAFLALLGWAIFRPAPVVETPAAEVRQDDGSLVLQREASGPITPATKPAHTIPPRARVERIVKVKVQPNQPPAGQPCPPVTVDMTLVRELDGSRRVIASSPDGQVVAGMDIPVETIYPTSGKWAAGLSLDPIHQAPGVWLERDLSRIRVGVEINQVAQKNGGTTGGEIRLRLGMTW